MGLIVRADNSGKFGEELRLAIARGMEEIGIVCEAHAKDYCPVDTGRLRNSIAHVVTDGGLTAQIGTNVEYGPYVELGTSRAKAQPYLVPAVEQHANEYRAALEKHIMA